MIRLFVIEDHAAIIVAGLKRLFFASRDGIEVTGFATSVEEAIENADPDAFDLIILDLWLENRLPVVNIKKVKSQFPEKPVLIYTSESSLVWKRRMMEEKAMGYVTKSASRSEIKTAIETVAGGLRYFPGKLEDVNAKKVIVSNEDPALTISPLQMEMLAMLANGANHKEIAKTIGTSLSSLEKILKTLRDQYEAHNNIELLSKINKMAQF
jgi:DNA-binding NarL/FixJ family response regulator